MRARCDDVTKCINNINALQLTKGVPIVPRIYGTVDKDIAKWADNMINSGKFYNMSHLIAQGLSELRKIEGEVDIDDSVRIDSRSVVPPVQPFDGPPEVQVPEMPED